ncbi:MAG TPA: cbb3-type cytochrome c oxidase subunit I [Opitutaceae bacterium]|nr:cbb3-type cytochrome c oxidase subunit I [Opitutaceae bacterium]
MTTAPTHASQPPVEGSASAEVTAIDSTARGPLLLLVGAAVKWLVIGSVLALITSIQLFKPAFLADCSWFTHGRAEAMRETIFIYGWAANAGLAIALWVLARLGGSPLRAGNWIGAGAIFWNLGLLVGLIGIATGDATSISFLQLPRYVQPFMLFAYGAIAIAGVLAWTGRRHDQTFASHWYAVAALFLFPWIFSVAQVMLLWAPVRGTLQAVVAGWYVQGAWTLWLAPLALSGAYYLVPKITGRVIPSYVFWTSLSFWTLVFVGAWTGGRHLVGGPVPAWIPTFAIGSCSLLLFHYFMVLLNLRHAFRGGSVALNFIAFGLVAYVAGGAADAVTSLRFVAKVTQFTHFIEAQQQLALYGGVSMMFFGAIYFLVPRVAGRVWASGALVRGHFFLTAVGVLLLVAALAKAGLTQGHGLNTASVSFAQIAADTRTSLLIATAAQGILLLGNLIFAFNFFHTACSFSPSKSGVPVTDLLRQPSTMEAPAS